MRLLACAVAAVACSGAAPRAPGADSDDATVAPSRGAIVVELFTSQGCSSCPPADRLLTALVAGERTRPVIALAFHVDYWNDLGWRDPFSSPLATARQEAYARTLDRGLYTPQLVVNGRAHAVGSRRADVERALAAAVPVPAMAASVDLVGDSVVVRADAPGGTHALLAVFEDDLATDVPAGENRGEHLRNDRVVRALVPLVDGGARVPLAPSWRRERLGAVVLAQRDDAAIVAATELDL